MDKVFNIASYIILIVIILAGWIYTLNYLLPYSYKSYIMQYARAYELDPSLVCAVINTESRFKQNAKSSAGAVGLMQLMPSTANELAKKLNIDNYDLYDAKTNIQLGCYYLSKLINQYAVLQTALCAYNAGPNTVNQWLNDTKYSVDKQTLTHIPYKETANYIRKVDIFRTFYTNIYNP